MIKINKRKVAIVSAYRSPIGVYKKTFLDTDIIDMASVVVKKAMESVNLKNNEIDSIILGSVLQGGRGQNVARQVGLKSGIDIKTPAYTVNMVCGSGLKAVMLGASEILTEENDIVIVGGLESMSTSDLILKDGLTDAMGNYHMGITAENVAKKYNLSRKELDEFSLSSQKKAAKAIEQGKFKDEIVEINGINTDNFVRANQTMEKLSKLNPAFLENGVVTAGNTTGINDGVAILILMSDEKAKELGLEVLGYIESYASSGLEPEYMGLGPIYSTRKLLKKENLKIEDIDIFEINEAFASQSIAVIRELGLDIEKVNVNGGAIALGHPIGATGARLIVTLVHEMKKQKLNKGLASLCVGGGQGLSMIIGR